MSYFIQHIKGFVIAIVVLVCSLSPVFAQTYPVQANVYIAPPYSSYLSDYYTGSREKLIVTLLNRDQQKPMLEVRLRMTITAVNGLKLQSREESNYPGIILDAGIPVRLTPEDLAPYFRTENLLTQGSFREGKLPDGMVEFSFQAIERYTGKALSAMGTGRLWLTTQKPPLLRLPDNNDDIAFLEPLNIRFQWEPQHRNLSQVEYEFELRELPNNGASPQSAFLYSPVIHQERLNYTYLMYNVLMPPLDPDKTYGWRVRAIAKDGVDEVNLFENGGNSEIHWFRLSASCLPPSRCTASLKDRTLNLEWLPSDNNLEFVVQYRLKNATGAEWQQSHTYQHQMSLYGLQRGSAYEYRVGSICTAGKPVFGNTTELTVPAVDSARLARCGLIGDFNLENRELLEELKAGDVVKLSDYPMTVTKVTGGSGNFAGEGWVPVNWLLNTKWLVEFDNIQVNTDYQLIGGSVRGQYDPKKLDEVTEGSPENTRNGIIRPDIVLDFVVPPNPVFDYNPDSGELVIYDTNGNESGRVEVKPNEGQEVFPLTLKDKDGNLYQISETKDENGTGVLSSTYLGQQTDPLPDNSFNLQALTSNTATVRFEQGDGQYSLDAWNPEYKNSTSLRKKYDPLGGNYYASWKFLPVGGSDKVIAKVEIQDKSKIKAENIIFTTPQGTRYEAKAKNENTFEITLAAGQAKDIQEIYALHPEGDSQSKYYTLGKLDAVTYEKQTNPLVVVQVNGKINESALQKRLDDIYHPVGVSWTIKDVENFDYPGDVTKFFEKGSGLFHDYNSKMNALISAYKQENPTIDKNANYIFILQNSGSADSVGFMPPGKQFGFVFVNSRSADKVHTTVAHELGHGRWKLQHTFDGTGLGKGDLKDNLMNYSGGIHLGKWQWEVMDTPPLFTNPFKEDEGAMSAEKNYMVLENDGIFFTPVGDPLFLPKGTKIYSPVIDYRFLPNWPVYIFETNGGKYVASVNIQTANPIFYGYKKEGSKNDYYNESSNRPAVGTSVIVTLVKHRSEEGYDILSLHESEQTYLIPKLSSANTILIVTPYTGDVRKVDESNKLTPYGTVGEPGVDWTALETGLSHLNKRLTSSWNVNVIDKDGESHSVATGNKGTVTYKYNTEKKKWEAILSGIADDEVNKIIADAINKKLDAFRIDENRKAETEVTTTTPISTEDGGEFRFGDGLHWYEWGSALCDVGVSIYEKGNLPETFWNQDDSKYKDYPLHTPGTVAGVSDGAIEEVLSIPLLVKFGVEVITDKEMAKALWESVKNINVESIKNAAVDFYDKKKDQYTSNKPYIVGHAAGYDAVQVATIVSGGSAIFTKGSKESLEKGMKETGEVLGKKVRKFTQKEIDDYVKLATKQNDKTKVMLGEYVEGGANSYHVRAQKEGYTYFSMDGKWDEAKNIVNNGVDESWKQEMWKINKEFINQQKSVGKEFYFSQEPWDFPTKTFRSKEAEYLIDLGAKDFVKIDNNTWRVIW